MRRRGSHHRVIVLGPDATTGPDDEVEDDEDEDEEEEDEDEDEDVDEDDDEFDERGGGGRLY